MGGIFIYSPRTDLAVESRETVKEKGILDDGILYNEENIDDIVCATVEITNKRAEELSGRAIGTYITIDFGKIWLKDSAEFRSVVDLTARKLSELSNFRNTGSILVVGLGNSSITADAVGPKALSHVLITRHLKEHLPTLSDEFGDVDIAGIAPGVLGQTGVESAEIVLSLAQKIKPDLIIAVDALASRRLARLGTTVQLSNTGLAPGSGVGNRRKAFDKEFFGTEVISIGVPTVVDAATLEEDAGNFFVTPKDTDVIINETSKIIGYAINRAFYPNIAFDEMTRLV